MHERNTSEVKMQRMMDLCICCQVETRLKHITERTKDRHSSISGFCFSVRLELGTHTGVTFCSDQLQHLVSATVFKVYTTRYSAALCIAALAKQSPETVCKSCFHQSITRLQLMMQLTHASLITFYMKYLQSDLTFIWTNHPPL